MRPSFLLLWPSLPSFPTAVWGVLGADTRQSPLVATC